MLGSGGTVEQIQKHAYTVLLLAQLRMTLALFAVASLCWLVLSSLPIKARRYSCSHNNPKSDVFLIFLLKTRTSHYPLTILGQWVSKWWVGSHQELQDWAILP